MFQPCAFPHLLDAVVIDGRQTKPLTCTSCAMLSLQKSLFNGPDDFFFQKSNGFPAAKHFISVSDVDNNEVSDTKLTAVIQSYEKQVLHDFGLKKHKFITNILKTNLELLT